MLTVLPAKK